jgi:hypothetical protein
LAGASQGYESSSEESVEEENNLVGRDTDKSMEEDENGTENSIGDVDTDEEEEGPVTVLKRIWEVIPLYLLLPPPPIL